MTAPVDDMETEIERLTAEVHRLDTKNADLQTECEDLKADNDRLIEEAVAAQIELEDLGDVGHDLSFEAVDDAIQEAHARAHHVGHWRSCPNLVCRGLEEWMLHARKEIGLR